MRTSTYIRVGSSNRLADEATIRQLERESLGISFDETPVPLATVNHLESSLFQRYLQRRQKARGTEPEEVSAALMLKLKAVVQEEERLLPPVGGVLLFCPEPQRFFPQARIQAARFKGSTTDEFIDQQDIGGSLLEQVDQCLNFIKRNIRLRGVVKGLQREDRYEYPLPALREALINAIVHRDYSISGTSIRVAIFDDCVEISSPGLLPTGISLEQLGTGASEIRNRMLARSFKDMGLIEEWGRGTRIMREAMVNAGLPAPVYQEVGRDFRVTLYGPGNETDIPVATLNDRQKRLLVYLEDKKDITNRQYQEIFGVSHTTAYKDLLGLVGRGLLGSRGKGKGTRYYLAKGSKG